MSGFRETDPYLTFTPNTLKTDSKKIQQGSSPL